MQLGWGTYFAEKFSLSAQSKFVKPDEDGYKHIFFCRVLTGVYTVGNTKMVSAPVHEKNRLYDSVVDSDDSPSVYVTFADWSAYPSYHIKFKDE